MRRMSAAWEVDCMATGGVWSQLQQHLASTLEDIYTLCEADCQAELVASTVRYLEQSAQEFKQLARCTAEDAPGNRAPGQTRQQPARDECCPAQRLVRHGSLPLVAPSGQQLMRTHSAGASCRSCSSCGHGLCLDASQTQDVSSSPSSSTTISRSSSCTAVTTAEACPTAADTASARRSPDSSCSSVATTPTSLVAAGAAASAASGSPSGVSGPAEGQAVRAATSRLAKGVSAADSLKPLDAEESSSSGLGDAAVARYLAEMCQMGNCPADSHSKGSRSSSPSQVQWQGGANRVHRLQGLLHHKLSSPDRLRKTPSEIMAAADDRQARAERLRATLAGERIARLRQEQLAKQQRRKEDPDGANTAAAAAARIEDRAQASELRRAAHLRRIRAKAGDEGRKVEEISFINSLNTQGRKADLQQRLEEGEARRQEALGAILAKQAEVEANIREAAERRRQAEAERLAALAEKQRRKEEAQAKIDQERRAAAAAREAAKAAARATAQQREAQRQQQAQHLSNRTAARLKQAAQRRLQHLELIRERAALGKDFERAVSFNTRAGSHAGSRCASPALVDAATSTPGGGGHDASSRLSAASSSSSSSSSGLGAASSGGSSSGSSRLPSTPLNAAAPCFCPTPAAAAAGRSSRYTTLQVLTPEASSSSSSSSSSSAPGPRPAGHLRSPAAVAPAGSSGARSRTSTPSPASPASAAPLPSEVLAQLEGNSQAVAQAGLTPAGSARTSIKGARRRMAKARRKLLEPQGCFTEPEAAVQLSQTPDAQQLLAAWAPHLALLNAQPTQQPQQPQQQSGPAAGSSGSRQAPAEPSNAQRREALAALVCSARSHLARQPLPVCHLARQTGLLLLVCKEVLAMAGDISTADPAAAVPGAAADAAGSRARQDKLQQARLLALLARLLELPLNLDFLLSCGRLLPVFAKAALAALDHCNSLEPDEMTTGGDAACRLSMLLQVLVAVLEHPADSRHLADMQEELVGFIVAAGMLRRLANVFSLFDQPTKDAARPVPPHVLQCLRLLRGLTAVRCPSRELLPGKLWPAITPHAAAIIMELQATAMAGVLSLLTAVLLNAAPSCTPAEASCKALPPNFVEAAHLVMTVLNNVCCLDLQAAQHLLSCTHNRLEFFHLISFLLSYCSSRWPAPAPARHTPHPAAAAAARQRAQAPAAAAPAGQQLAVVQQPCAAAAGGAAAAEAAMPPPPPPRSCGGHASPKLQRGRAGVAAVVHHPIAELLNEVLLLLGFFCVLHPSNQAMLQWGRSPSILQRLCSIPAAYCRVPELRSVAVPTLLAVCFKAHRACETVAQHLSLEVLLQWMQQEQQRHLPQQQEQGQEQQQSEHLQQQQQPRAGVRSSWESRFSLARRIPPAIAA